MKYIIKLSEPAHRDRYLDLDNIFVYEKRDAVLFATTSHALQGIHDRGVEAGRNRWPTGNGSLHIEEVPDVPVPRMSQWQYGTLITLLNELEVAVSTSNTDGLFPESLARVLYTVKYYQRKDFPNG